MSTALNILIEQGTTFKTYVELSDDDDNILNINGYTFQGSLKRDYQSTNTTPFTCTIEDANNGVISIELDDTVSAVMKPGRYVYDVISIDTSDTIIRLFEGLATLTPNVTVAS